MKLDLDKLQRLELAAIGEKAIVEALRESLADRRREVIDARRVATLTIQNARLPRELLHAGPRDAGSFVAKYESNPSAFESALASVPNDAVTRSLRMLRDAIQRRDDAEHQLATAEAKFLSITGTVVRLRDFASQVLPTADAAHDQE